MKSRRVKLGADASAFDRHDEMLSHEGMISIGVGPEIIETTGLTEKRIADQFAAFFEDFVDGGAELVQIQGGDGQCCLAYARRQDRRLDIGTRADFATLGWEWICDKLDKKDRT